jgi:hypothetical protein
VSYPHISPESFAELLVFAARQYYDEPSAKCTAWFRGEQGCVTILVNGENVSLAWTGTYFAELPNVRRCVECGREPGTGVFWEDDDRGDPYEAGCDGCHEWERVAAAE